MGRSHKCDICIPGTYVSRNHGKLIFHAKEEVFYYEALGQNALEFETSSYQILEGAILPFPESIELKLSYVK